MKVNRNNATMKWKLNKAHGCVEVCSTGSCQSPSTTASQSTAAPPGLLTSGSRHKASFIPMVINLCVWVFLSLGWGRQPPQLFLGYKTQRAVCPKCNRSQLQRCLNPGQALLFLGFNTAAGFGIPWMTEQQWKGGGVCVWGGRNLVGVGGWGGQPIR